MIKVISSDWRRLLFVVCVSVASATAMWQWAHWESPDAVRLAVQFVVLGLLVMLMQHGEDDRRNLRAMIVVNSGTLDAALTSLSDRARALEIRTAEIAAALSKTTAETAHAVEVHFQKIGNQLVENIGVAKEAAAASAEAAHVANRVNEKIASLGMKVIEDRDAIAEIKAIEERKAGKKPK